MKLAKVRDIVAESERIATITIRNPDGEPYRASDGTEATISFTGPESKAYITGAEEAARQGAYNQQLNGKADAIEMRRQHAASVVTGWHGWEGDDDIELPCTRDNVLMLLSAPHILSQVAAAIENHSRFFAKRSPN